MRALSTRAALVLTVVGCSGAPQVSETPSAAAAEGEASAVATPYAPEWTALSTEGITFERGTEELRATAAGALDELAGAIGRGEAGHRARVRVTMDPDPRACSDAPLARTRADVLRAALVARGVGAERLTAEGVSGPLRDCAPALVSRSTVTVEMGP